MATASSGFEEWDSAGVKMALNRQDTRRLEVEEILRVGVVGGDPNLQFDRVRSVRLDPEGGFWVVDSHESIRHYDQEGAYLSAVGGRGNGPGEAPGYGDVWVRDGAVLAQGFPSVLQEFSKDGALLASRNAQTEAGERIQAVAGTTEGWLLTLQRFPFDGTGPTRWSVTPVRGERLTGPWDTIGHFPGELYIPLPNMHAARASYFVGNPSFASDASGRLHVSDTLEYEVSSYGPGGVHDRTLIRRVDARSYDPAWEQEIVQAMGATFDYSEERIQGLVDRAIPEPPPEHLPFIRDLLVAHDGTLWVERADVHPRPAMAAIAHAVGYVRHAWEPEWVAPQVFDIFNPRGQYRGTVELPGEYEPMAVTANQVYGVWYDELDVEFIVAFQLQENDS